MSFEISFKSTSTKLYYFTVFRILNKYLKIFAFKLYFCHYNLKQKLRLNLFCFIEFRYRYFIGFLKYFDKLGQIKQDTQVVVPTCQNSSGNLQGLFQAPFILYMRSAFY